MEELDKNLDRDFKGIWIPKEIWLNQSLTTQEKVMYAEIDSLCGNVSGCFASNAYLSNFFGLSLSRTRDVIYSLEEKKLIKVRIYPEQGNKRRIDTLCLKTSIPYAEKQADPMTGNRHYIIKSYNKDDNTLTKVKADKSEYGNKDINLLIEYFKKKLNLNILDDSDKINRRYAYLLLKKCKDDVNAVLKVIDVASSDEFWKIRVTSFKCLYNNAVKIVGTARQKPKGVIIK